jgi:ABC-type transport system involved in multi-copper enzyme maturation permease subunit
MTADTATIAPLAASAQRGGMFLGFANSLRKEMAEWFRSPKALIVLAVSISGAIFMTLIPFIARATGEATQADLLTMDPTANVLLGWTGQTVPFIAVLSTMALLTAERDRGTLAWSLSHPVSPTSIIASKFVAAVLVVSVIAVVLPMFVSIAIATFAYGALPDLAVIASFSALFLALPVFYIGLTIGMGTVIKSTGGVAGVAFAVMFVPQIIGGLVPVANQVSPTSIGTWALAVANGQAASALTPIGWLISMVAICVGAKSAFDRQEH